MSNLAFTLPALKPEKCHRGAGGEGIVRPGESVLWRIDLGESF
jgi:hypothetical protein